MGNAVSADGAAPPANPSRRVCSAGLFGKVFRLHDWFLALEFRTVLYRSLQNGGNDLFSGKPAASQPAG